MNGERMNRFKDKVVIVTGGGAGIGEATAIAFAHEGAQVVVADISEAQGSATVAAIHVNGGKAVFTATDTGDAASVNTLVESAVKAFGQLDVYFSNAGIIDGFAPCSQTTDDIWSRVIDINLSGYFYGARAALPHLIKSKGNIVMTASVAGLGALTGGTAYTASKHGVAGLIHQIACEVAAQGVRVNGVAPGPVMTSMARAQPNLDDVTAWVKGGTPMGRWGEPEEIAAAVLFLASDAASFITGTMLRVDGGWRSK
jgi:NAD(P)-dependent dehydrogenase (short-subunit alcohol dehydrogenase family)